MLPIAPPPNTIPVVVGPINHTGVLGQFYYLFGAILVPVKLPAKHSSVGKTFLLAGLLVIVRLTESMAWCKRVNVGCEVEDDHSTAPQYPTRRTIKYFGIGIPYPDSRVAAVCIWPDTIWFSPFCKNN